MSHGVALATGRLSLVHKLPGIHLIWIIHKSSGIDDATTGIGVAHMRKAVAILVGDGVIHPSAHSVGPERHCAATLVIKKGKVKRPLNGVGDNGDGAVARRGG